MHDVNPLLFYWIDIHTMSSNSNSNNTITVNVSIKEDDNNTINKETNKNADGDSATLFLFLHDQQLMDVAATKAGSASIHIPSGLSSTIVQIEPDLTVTQNGKRYNEMIHPSFYISLDNLDNNSSTLTYTDDGPIFGIQPGQKVNLKLQRKK